MQLLHLSEVVLQQNDPFLQFFVFRISIFRGCFYSIRDYGFGILLCIYFTLKHLFKNNAA